MSIQRPMLMVAVRLDFQSTVQIRGPMMLVNVEGL